MIATDLQTTQGEKKEETIMELKSSKSIESLGESWNGSYPSLSTASSICSSIGGVAIGENKHNNMMQCRSDEEREENEEPQGKCLLRCDVVPSSSFKGFRAAAKSADKDELINEHSNVASLQ